MLRKICYVSGTRADYGLMRNLLLRLHASPDFELGICVTGMHLSERYGHTVDEIIADGLPIIGKVPVDADSTTHRSMVQSIGHEIIAFSEIFYTEKPDIVLVLGDRGETLAAAICATHLNIIVVHIHGGERSGTIDEMVRHAISKFSHYHFVATEAARERLIRMGEQKNQVYLIGAPGLDDIITHKACSLPVWQEKYALNGDKKTALLIFHPVIQEYDHLESQMQDILKAIFYFDLQLIALEPNSDAGAKQVKDALHSFAAHPNLRILTHLSRQDYFDCLTHIDLLIGNSSSGIIEAASFDLSIVNIGSRQQLRERSANVVDVAAQYNAVKEGLEKALLRGKQPYENVYGDGHSSARAFALLKQISLSSTLLSKCNEF